jgi:hypothetical protein
MHMLRTESGLPPTDKLRAALGIIIAVSRRQPYLYQLMFTTPAGDPAAVVTAAQRLCDEFDAVVTEVAGEENTERYAAILLTAAHGAAGLESSGLLSNDKWHTTADDLTDTLVAILAERDRGD